MARKSRKTNVVAPAETSCVTKTYRTAIYVRLSYEDERKIEQESVENQVAFLKAFVDGAADLTLMDKYIDRGVSGAYFDRPDFNRMMNDMKAGKLDCIVVKDLSRLGRNYLEAGDYIDKIFPFFGVRFIAVTDDYDSLTSEPAEDGLIVPLKNLINEAYAKDISRKIRSSIDNMYRDGIMVASSIAYGYLKDPDGDHQIMIDEVAAPVVRRIFDEYIGGKGVSSIAKGLNEDGISSPSVRRFETGARKKRKYEKMLWLGKTVNYIITNSIYTGDLEMGKRRSDLCKGIKDKAQSKEERFLVKAHHEAIISHEIFERAQEIHECRRKTSLRQGKIDGGNGKTRESVLAGILFCGDCRRKMNIRRYSYQLKSGLRQDFSYVCPRSASYGDEDPHKNFNADEAEETVAELIRQHISAYTDTVESLRSVNRKPQAVKKRRECEKKLKDLAKRKDKISGVLSGLYSDYADGVFTEKEYMDVKQSYIHELADIEAEADVIVSEEKTWQVEYEGQSDMVNAFRKYAGFEKLTNEIASIFIKRIYYYSDKRMEVEYTFDKELLALIDLLKEREA